MAKTEKVWIAGLDYDQKIHVFEVEITIRPKTVFFFFFFCDYHQVEGLGNILRWRSIHKRSEFSDSKREALQKLQASLEKKQQNLQDRVNKIITTLDVLDTLIEMEE